MTQNCVTNTRVGHLMGRRVKSTYMYLDIPMQAIYNRFITSKVVSTYMDEVKSEVMTPSV